MYKLLLLTLAGIGVVAASAKPPEPLSKQTADPQLITAYVQPYTPEKWETILEPQLERRNAQIAEAFRLQEEARIREEARIAQIKAQEAAQAAQAAKVIAQAPKPVIQQVKSLSGDVSVWDKLALCESGGRWDYNGASGFDGGIQFSPTTWNSMGTGYAFAWQAPREVQIAAGQRLQARSGWGQWPACARKLGLL